MKKFEFEVKRSVSKGLPMSWNRLCHKTRHPASEIHPLAFKGGVQVGEGDEIHRNDSGTEQAEEQNTTEHVVGSGVRFSRFH